MFLPENAFHVSPSPVRSFVRPCEQAFRVVIAWIYSVSGHSLFAAVVCHTSFNTAWQLFPNQGSGYNPWIAAALTWGVVIGVCTRYRTVLLAGPSGDDQRTPV